MTEIEAIEDIRENILPCVGGKSLEMAIKALEKQKKIKEAFEMWKTETGGYYGADDETTMLISALSQILRSDEE